MDFGTWGMTFDSNDISLLTFTKAQSITLLFRIVFPLEIRTLPMVVGHGHHQVNFFLVKSNQSLIPADAGSKMARELADSHLTVVFLLSKFE